MEYRMASLKFDPNGPLGRLIDRAIERAKIPSFFKRPAKIETPPTQPVGKTGDARYVPSFQHDVPRKQRKPYLVTKFDRITWADYDRARFYPVVRDGIRMIRLAVRRSNFHFSSSNEQAAELAEALLRDEIPKLLDVLVKGALEFGFQCVETRWKPFFSQTVTSGQTQSAGAADRFYPFVWGVDRFAVFAPSEIRILIDPGNGDFWGIEQFVGSARMHKIPRDRLIHFVHENEFDTNYGVPLTKAAIPFIDGAENVIDSMNLYANIFATPWKIGRYPHGRTEIGTDGSDPVYEANSDLMISLLDSLESAHSIGLPSDRDMHGQPKWDVTITPTPGEDRYVEKLDWYNSMIRMAIAFPEMAGSSSPDTGTYNLGQTVLDLFLANVQAIQDDAAKAINQQLLNAFRIYNFGYDAADISIQMEPVDFSARKALLQALVDYLGQGQPMPNGDTDLSVDWAKLAENMGVPLLIQDPRQLAGDVTNAALQRLQGMDGPIQAGGAPEEPTAPGTPQFGGEDPQTATASLASYWKAAFGTAPEEDPSFATAWG